MSQNVNDYDVRRLQMEAYPGLPFLLPYQNAIASYQENGAAQARILTTVFSFVAYNRDVDLVEQARKLWSFRYYKW